MTETAVYLQPAYILQHRPYRESSVIIDVLTRDYGKLSLLAKGVRKKKSKTAGLLQPFIPLALSYLGQAELKTLTGVEISQAFTGLSGMALYCGFYANELVSFFLQKEDPHPEVFDCYQQCLLALADNAKIEAALRVFEINLMDNIGYGLQLQPNVYDQEPLKKYQYSTDDGLVAADDGLFSGASLAAIQAQQFTDPQVLAEAKQLMRIVIDSHLQGRQLKTRAVINNIIKHTK